MYDSPLWAQFCGGTLISEKHVITSAWCATYANYYTLYVHLGDTILGNEFDVTFTKTLAVVQWNIHPDYVDQYPFNTNNIAVLEMEEAVPLNQYPNIKPACLPDQGADFLGNTATVVGWGYDVNLDYSSWLHELQATVFADEECATLTPSELCAGTQGIEVPCFGDNGGPLLVSDSNVNNNGLTVAGIVSNPDCVNLVQTYTKVSLYYDWINGIIGGATMCPPPPT